MRPISSIGLLLLASVASLVSAAPPQLAPRSAAPSKDVVFDAMRAELARSVTELQLEKLEKAYFVSYTVSEDTVLSASASLGALLGRGESRSRRLNVEVRVGDRKLDNSGYLGVPSAQSGVIRSFGSVALPLDDDYTAIRRQLWLATDAAYKRALEDLSRKRAFLEGRTRTDDSADFTDAASAQVEDVTPVSLPRLADLEALAKTVSAAYRGIPDVSISRVSIVARSSLTRYLNSEGTSFKRSNPRASIMMGAATQAEDGTPLEDADQLTARTAADWPPPAELSRRAVDLGTRLARLRSAPALDSYNGPVLFEGQAAAELLAQVFVPRLLATRPPVIDDERMAGAPGMGATENPFLDKIGARVLPASLRVIDDPTRTRAGDAALVSGYSVDDEGVPTRATTLVDAGILKTLLSTRRGVRGITSSTGSRRGGGPMASNLIVTPAGGSTVADLKAALLASAKQRGLPFGLVVRRLGSPALMQRPFAAVAGPRPRPDGDRVEPACSIAKLFPDGHEEPVRIAEITGFRAESFKEIAAVSSETSVHTTSASGGDASTYFAIMSGMGSTREPVSLSVPSLLFDEMSLRKPSGEIPRPPVAPRPPLATN